MEWSEVEPVLDATYRFLADEEQTTQEAVCEAAGRAPGDERTIRALGDQVLLLGGRLSRRVVEIANKRLYRPDDLVADFAPRRPGGL